MHISVYQSLPKTCDFSACSFKHASEHRNSSCFTRTIVTKQTEYFIFVEIKGQVIDSREVFCSEFLFTL
jgi:hypothetical protein